MPSEDKDTLSQLRHGKLVLARVLDRNGFAKVRPVLILSQDDEIAADSPILAVAVTTTFGDPPPKWHVPLPWNADPRRVGTRLDTRSAAVVSWPVELSVDDVLGVKGDVPRKLLAEILRLAEQWSNEQEPA